jgi:hypothetical protein
LIHATNTIPVDRHPQYRHYPRMIPAITRSIIIIEVKTITSRSKLTCGEGPGCLEGDMVDGGFESNEAIHMACMP